jgi:hypothetical protein
MASLGRPTGKSETTV